MFESHVHHRSAKAWFNGLSAADGCAFCRLTQQGFLRLVTNPKAFADEAVTLADAWRLYDKLLADFRISFAVEPPGVEASWREYSSTREFSPKVWNDAYLVAFSREARNDLITFDQGFSQYTGLACMILS